MPLSGQDMPDRILLSQSPVPIFETMHVKFANLVNSPHLLLSLPDRDGESYFASYPNTDETVIPLISQEEPMALLEPAQGTQEEALPAVEPAEINVELPAIYGDDHFLVPEYEYQEFLACFKTPS